MISDGIRAAGGPGGRGSGRSAGAAVILTIASWCLVSGMTGLWMRSTFLEPEGFARVVTTAFQGSDEFQQQLSSEVLDEAFARGGAEAERYRPQTEEALNDVIASGEVDGIIEQQLIALHAAILDPQAEGNDLDLTEVVAPVQRELDARGVDYRIPTEQFDKIQIPISAALSPLREAAAFAKVATLLLPIIGLLAVGVGMLVSDRRLRSLRWLGWNVAISAGVIALFSYASQSLVGSAMDAGGIEGTGVAAAWSAMSSGLVTRMVILSIIGVLVAVGAWIGCKKVEGSL